MLFECREPGARQSVGTAIASDQTSIRGVEQAAEQVVAAGPLTSRAQHPYSGGEAQDASGLQDHRCRLDSVRGDFPSGRVENLQGEYVEICLPHGYPATRYAQTTTVRTHPDMNSHQVPFTMTPQITVVIPAYEEQAVLPQTLAALALARQEYACSGLGAAEVVVVDNASTDRTAAVATAAGVRVLPEPQRGIAAARNAGAAAASAPWLFFLDADTWVPSDVLIAIHRALADPECFGGALATRYDSRKRVLKPYMAMWKIVARVRGMAQGVGQFVTAEAFHRVGGYPDLAMAEDTEFYWRLTRDARHHGGHTTYLADTVIVPSSRRYDKWPVWRTILMTNPITTRMFLRSRRFWSAWGERSVR